MKTTAIHLLFLVIKIATAGAAALYHDLKYDTGGGGFIEDDQIMIEDDEIRGGFRSLYHALEFFERDRMWIEDDEMKYIERIQINKRTDTVLYDVPKHAKVEHGEYLTDYKSRLTIMKLKKMNRCYAIPIEDDEPTLTEIEAGIRQFNGKFPRNKFWAQNINFLPVGVIDNTFLPQAIRNYCGAYPVLKVVKTNNVTEMERAAANTMDGYLNGRTNRGIPLPEHILCEDANKLPNVLDDCKAKYGKTIPYEKIVCKCRFFYDKTCVYTFKCTYSASIKKYNCDGVHKWISNHCCSAICI